MHFGILGGGPIGLEMALAAVRLEVTVSLPLVTPALQARLAGHAARARHAAVLLRARLGPRHALQPQRAQHDGGGARGAAGAGPHPSL